MKTRLVFRFLIILFSANIFLGANRLTQAEEINTSLGKVIVGITKAQAQDKFGSPDLATEVFWYYLNPAPFFVYFTQDAPVAVYLYPQFLKAAIGDTIELKVFCYSARSAISSAAVFPVTAKCILFCTVMKNSPGS